MALFMGKKIKQKISNRRGYLLTALIIIVAVEFLAIVVRNDQGANNLANLKVVSNISEVKLATALGQGYSAGSLRADLGIIEKANTQTVSDQNLAASGARDSSYRSTNPITEKQRRANLLGIAAAELKATVFLSNYSRNSLTAQVTRLEAANKSMLSEADLAAAYNNFAAQLIRVENLKTADDIRVCSGLLVQFAARLNSAVIASGLSGVAFTDSQADITTLSSDLSAASNLAKPIEGSLTNTTPRTALQQNYLNRLKTGVLDEQAAINAAAAAAAYIGG